VPLPVYVLGCEELPRRKQLCLDHLRSVGVDPVWWRSVHGKTWGLETVREYDAGRRISPGHVGLLLGHWTLWNHLLNLPPQYGGGKCSSLTSIDAWIVLEDDVYIPHASLGAIQSEVSHQLNQYNPDWDFVFLGLAEPEGPRVWNKITERIGPPGSRLCRLEWPWGTHAYMVRRRALPVLLDNMAFAERNVDQQLYERVLSRGLLNWCAVLPSLVRQRTYDHEGTGTPEWAPSTVSEADGPDRDSSAAARYVETEAKREQRPVEQSADVLAASLRLTDPFPCIYRGESLEIVGSVGSRSIPLDQCARLNRPCFSRRQSLPVTFNDAVGRQAVATPCETCELRAEMAPADRVRPRLPLPEGHFNPSLCVYRGRMILATRDSWGHSKVALWDLKSPLPQWGARIDAVSLEGKGGLPDVQHITYDDPEWVCEPVSSVGSDHPEAPRLEDPRLFTMPWPTPDSERRLCSMFNLPDGYPPKLVQVGYVVFSEDLQRIEHTEVFKSPPGNLYEKNWIPFWDPNERQLKWSYAWKPYHVVIEPGDFSHPSDEIPDVTTHATPNPLPWTGGVIRGGAAPVRIDLGDGEVLYYFFHGALKRPQGTVYTVGCLVTEGRPPYRVLRQTPTPLIWPDLPAIDETVVKRYVVWPGGAVLAYGSWWLALGIDDTCCRIHRLSIQEVDAALRDVPESEDARTTSIRDTEIALGIKPD